MKKDKLVVDEANVTSNGSGAIPNVGDSTPVSSPSPNSKIMVKLRLPLLESTLEKTVLTTDGETANQFLEKMYKKYYEKILPNRKYTEFVFKVPGVVEYIVGDEPFSKHKYVSEKLSKGQKIELSLLEKVDSISEEEFEEEFPTEEFLKDPTLTYDHEQIRNGANPWDQLACISIWDLNRNFRIKVVGADGVQTDTNDLFVTAGVYHGGELMSSMMTSQATSNSISPRWYEWLSTNMLLCNIPRVRKKFIRICLV